MKQTMKWNTVHGIGQGQQGTVRMLLTAVVWIFT